MGGDDFEQRRAEKNLLLQGVPRKKSISVANTLLGRRVVFPNPTRERRKVSLAPIARPPKNTGSDSAGCGGPCRAGEFHISRPGQMHAMGDLFSDKWAMESGAFSLPIQS
jgi:hypothetical protein